MTNENKELLEKLLIEWFNNLDKDLDINFWARNGVGAILKDELKKLSHWKNKSKGRVGNLKQLEAARNKRELIKKQKEESEKAAKLKSADW